MMRIIKRTFAGLALTVALLIAGLCVSGLIRGAAYFQKEPALPKYQTYYAGSMSFPGQFNATASATMNHMKMHGLGLHNFHDVHKHFPVGAEFDESGNCLKSWIAETGPYTTPFGFPGDYRQDEPWDSEYNAKFYRTVIPDLLNPSLKNAPVFDSRGFAVSHYATNQYVIGPGVGLEIASITDGTENTLLMGETASLFQAWGGPNNSRDPMLGLNKNPRGFGSHPDRKGVYFLFADGHVDHVSDAIDSSVLRALATPNAGD